VRLPLTVRRPAAEALAVQSGEVLRYLGYRPGVTRVEPRHQELVDRGIVLAVAAAAPAVAAAFCAIAIEGETVSTRVPGLAWRSRALTRVLGEAAGVSLVAATLGPAVEELTQRLFAAEEYALATVVDAAGSALVQALGRWVQGELAAEAARSGLTVTPLYGPGYGDWDIHDQIALTAAAGGAEIGLRSTETCYLIPQKLLVGVIGWTAGGGRRGSGCALCAMPDCAYRSRPSEGRMT